MERQYVAIDLHLQRSLVVRENEAGGCCERKTQPRSVGRGGSKLRLSDYGPPVRTSATSNR